MENITSIELVRSDGKRFIIDGSYTDENDWGIIGEIEGLDNPETELFTENKAVGDGTVITGQRIGARIINVDAICKITDDNATYRREVIEFFNSKYEFIFYVNYIGNKKWILGTLDGFSCPAKNIFENLELKFTLYCQNPYLNSIEPIGDDLAVNITSAFAFPFQVEKDMMLAGYTESESLEFSNDGDVETEMSIHLTFTGRIVNPIIKKGNSFIQINHTFYEDDEVIIDLDNLTITNNGENIIRYLDRQSSFTDMTINLQEKNIITCGIGYGDGSMNVTVMFNKRYMGV